VNWNVTERTNVFCFVVDAVRTFLFNDPELILLRINVVWKVANFVRDSSGAVDRILLRILCCESVRTSCYPGRHGRAILDGGLRQR